MHNFPDFAKGLVLAEIFVALVGTVACILASEWIRLEGEGVYERDVALVLKTRPAPGGSPGGDAEELRVSDRVLSASKLAGMGPQGLAVGRNVWVTVSAQVDADGGGSATWVMLVRFRRVRSALAVRWTGPGRAIIFGRLLSDRLLPEQRFSILSTAVIEIAPDAFRVLAGP